MAEIPGDEHEPDFWGLFSKRSQGVHLGSKAWLAGSSAEQEIELRGGFRDLTVAPGEAIVLELEVPHLSLKQDVTNSLWISSTSM
jgi:hypothetical protein